MTAELRRRKLKSQNVGSSSKKKSKDKDTSGIQRSLMCLIICATVLILFFGFYLDNTLDLGHAAVDQVAKHFGYHEPVYAVVIDAGSTGSRVLAFSFHKAYLDGRLVLDDELFVETKPGLSAFAKQPEMGAKSISGLLDKAMARIPEDYWGKTSLILKATAGLRLLPAAQAEGLLNAVRALFKKSPFVTDDESVSIMDGTDEGIFSWFTVNFLLNRLRGNPSRTVAALDLGGGSTQVTFAPTTPSTLKQREYIHDVKNDQGTIPVFTHSYLGLGLMAARKEIITHNHAANAKNVTSLCVNPFITNKEFHYHGVDYLVSGDDRYANVRGNNDPEVKFDDCFKIISDYVYTKVIPLQELHTKEINAFSYYFDRASEAGLIDPYKGGIVTVQQFHEAAKEACKTINVDQPFMCLDLSFIWVLLEHGFTLKQETQIKLFKKIQGHEISWALGAAFNHGLQTTIKIKE